MVGAAIPEAATKNEKLTYIINRVLNSYKLNKIGVAPIMRSIYYRLKKKRFALLKDYTDDERCNELVQVIQKLKPDIVHSLEIQHAGYLTLNAKKAIGKSFPTWIVTNWGADIQYFGEDPEHAPRIREVMENCDYYWCECQRDVTLGRNFGFSGEVLPVLTNTGGFDFDYINQFRQPGKSSDRKVILLKGYQGWVYKALIGLKAIEACADLIKKKGFRVAIYLASPGVPEAAMDMSKRTGIPVEMVPYTSHEHMLQLHGQARISLGLSLSDAISTSFLEAIVMGSFPIQSCTSCADEWITDGETGILVPPEDPDVIADALRRALTDDRMVDDASERNMQTLIKRLSYPEVQKTVSEAYQSIYRKHEQARSRA